MPPTAAFGERPGCGDNFRLLAFRTLRECISAVLSPLVCGPLFRQLQDHSSVIHPLESRYSILPRPRPTT